MRKMNGTGDDDSDDDDSDSDDGIMGGVKTNDLFGHLMDTEDADLIADEEEANRLRKLLELMEDLRKYDVDKIRSDELSGLQLMLVGL
jgi:hypothetical protein